MADGPLGALQTRLGPLPAWVWIVGGGAALYLLTKSGILRGLPGTSGARGQTGATGPAGSRYQGPPGPPGPPAPPTPPPPGPGANVAKANGTVWLHSEASSTSPVAGILAQGQTVPLAGAPVQGEQFTANYLPGSPSSNVWQPVTYAGVTVYAFSLDISIVPGPPTGGPDYGMGGAARAAGRPAARSRGESHWAWDGHPSHKLEHPVPHFVVAPMGGASIHAVARSAGVSPARLMAANPRFHLPRGGGDGSDESMGGFSDYQSQPMAGQGPSFGRGRRDRPFSRAGGDDEGMGGFSDYQSQPMAGQGPSFGPGRQDRPFTRAGGPARRGLRRYLPGRTRYGNDATTNYRGVGGPDDTGSGEELGGAQGASIFGVDPSLNYRTPQIPAGHVARAGQLIRIR